MTIRFNPNARVQPNNLLMFNNYRKSQASRKISRKHTRIIDFLAGMAFAYTLLVIVSSFI